MHSKGLAIAALAVAAQAAPSPQLFGSGGSKSTQNDLTNGNCKPIIFINARATGEGGNFGGSTGPGICDALKQKFSGQVACQGVGGAYKAEVMDNVGLRGTSAGAQAEAQSIFKQAVSKCPGSKVVASGYSQGSAVMNSAVSGLSKDIQEKILGVVLYGYTKNKQNSGKIQNFPGDKVLTFCASNDGVCGGGLSVTLGHFVYVRNGDIGKGADFLAQKIQAAGGASGGGAASGAAAPAAPAVDTSSSTSSSGASGLLGKLGGGSGSSLLSGLGSGSGSSLLSGLRGKFGGGN